MEDEALLNKLGVTAAKAEDVERDVIAHIEQASRDAAETSEEEEEQNAGTQENRDPARDKLLNQLATLQDEIEAVQGGLKLTQADHFLREEDAEAATTKEQDQTTSTSKLLHSTLASGRLKTLSLKKKQLRAQLKALDKAAASTPAPTEGQRKSVLIEDTNFDAALDASSGLIETERDRLIRIGALTPFDQVQGFERRVQRTSRVVVDEEKARETVSNAVASLAAISKARPTTKLLDAAELPKLEGPTREFRRLRKPIVPQAEGEKRSSTKRKRKRPAPEAKWRKRKSSSPLASEDDEEGGSGTEEVVLEGGLRIPADIYDKLFDYQKTGVKWMWELHCQNAGGIIGDEMGLGKTVQVVSFLAALHNSGMYSTSIVICPATLLVQWKREALKWYPKFEVEIIHDLAGSKKKAPAAKDSDDSDYENDETKNQNKSARWNDAVERAVHSHAGLIVTTYEQLRINRDRLLNIKWGYAVLDEGHKIKNPDADTTLICKQLQTVHRVIMTGAPIQNKLTELWSLFDFVFPGKLGVLPVFQTQFAVPIAIGGYANASQLQVSTAYKCAVVLRDLIMPYLLRRMKSDVEANLTKKSEHVLFCSLTEDQRAAYRAYLASSEVESIVEGSKNCLSGIDVLRKICNHPDLLDREQMQSHPEYGKAERSGKLVVTGQILSLWKTQGHRVLIFCQTQQMLDILESYIVSQSYVYRRMDGSTPIKQRMSLIDEFNESSHVFVMLLTTKVGGLGTNLTGANRVIIFDPDWNPSTDIQARERAWRIGQTKDVTIYRLITRGTIEEKVYHRQIYKQFLTNKVLRDPQQRRVFKSRDMRDLFVLQEDAGAEKTETSTLFADMEVQLKLGNEDKAKAPCKDSDESGEAGEANEQADESRILESLFHANGIHSAMDHDAIVSGNDSETLKLELEATKVAENAAQALQMSRFSRMREDVSVPTWTGNSGSAGAPNTGRRRFGASVNSRLLPSSGGSAGASSGRALNSTELVAQMRDRQQTAQSAGQDERANFLAGELRDFLRQEGGSALSTSIIDRFKNKLSSLEVPLFKQLLKEVATLNQEAGEKRWFLKQ